MPYDATPDMSNFTVLVIKGLLWGAVGATVLAEGVDAFVVRDALLRDGVITRAVNAETLTWCPPLVITDDEIDQIVDAVQRNARP